MKMIVFVTMLAAGKSGWLLKSLQLSHHLLHRSLATQRFT